MGPIITEIKNEFAGKLSVEVYNVHENPEWAERYQPRQLPSQIFLDVRGEEVWRHEGFSTKEDLIAKLKETGVEK